jgi:hypothetical protein
MGQELELGIGQGIGSRDGLGQGLKQRRVDGARVLAIFRM